VRRDRDLPPLGEGTGSKVPLAMGRLAWSEKRKTSKLDPIVAVKLLAPDPKYIDVTAFRDVEQHFKREGLRGARLRHENLIEIIAYEENTQGSCFLDGTVLNPFIVMEYVKGRTLESFIRKLAASWSRGGTFVNFQTLAIAQRIPNALSYVHPFTHSLALVSRKLWGGTLFPRHVAHPTLACCCNEKMSY
jgi:serine/threonine protein kinase